MTALQKLELRKSEIRQELSAIASGEGELTEEQRSSLTALKTEMHDLETRSQALILAGDEPVETRDDGEGREMRSMLEKARVGNICDAALGQRAIDGPEAEIQKNLGLNSNQVPLSMLRESIERRAVTPGIDANTSVERVLQPVFAQGAAAFLEIPMPTVPVGARNYPVLTTRPTVGGPHTDSTAVAETTGAFSANELKPERIQASFFYRRTDAARFAELDSSLRDALTSSLMEAHDYQVLRGTAGLFTGTNLSNNAASAKFDYAKYVSELGFGRVDGRFANTLMDLKVLCGAATYGHMGTLYNNPAYDSVANVLSNLLGGLRVTAHAPAVASKKQNAIVRLGMRRDAVSPIWEGISLVPDEVTQIGKGEIRLTAIMLIAMKVLRAGGFAKIETQHG